MEVDTEIAKVIFMVMDNLVKFTLPLQKNQYIQLVKVVYCKLQTNSKQLPASAHQVRLGFKL